MLGVSMKIIENDQGLPHLRSRFEKFFDTLACSTVRSLSLQTRDGDKLVRFVETWELQSCTADYSDASYWLLNHLQFRAIKFL